MGIASKFVGLLLSGAGAVILTYGMSKEGDWMLYVVGLFVMSLGLSLLTARRQPTEIHPPPPTVTEIHCDNSECDFREIRDFQRGDYVLKKLPAKCPRCGRPLTIHAIYVTREQAPSTAAS